MAIIHLTRTQVRDDQWDVEGFEKALKTDFEIEIPKITILGMVRI